jgi:nitrogenase iron protein NifH
MERLVFYGKGGIGKSTISANIAALLVGMDRRVLHVGCDPKHDSTVALMGGEMIPTVLDRDYGEIVRPQDIVRISESGVHCVESGGPQAGVGCAGRGISRAVEIFDKADLLSEDRYDVVIFDLLGDVVCGGFAAPLRHGVGEKVVIISSEEVMSLYAANNIARAVVTYASNGIACAGILLNLRDADEDLDPVYRFARLLGTEVLGVIRRDPLIREAEYRRITVAEHAPDSSIVGQFRSLAERIVAIDAKACPLPTPLSDRRFYGYARHRFDPPQEIRDAPSEPGTGPSAERARLAASPAPGEPPSAPSAPSAADSAHESRRRAYKRDLKAGIIAVRRGLVRPEEAVERLKTSYPEFTGSLRPRDLIT